jgi:hypothetical protein
LEARLRRVFAQAEIIVSRLMTDDDPVPVHWQAVNIFIGKPPRAEAGGGAQRIANSQFRRCRAIRPLFCEATNAPSKALARVLPRDAAPQPERLPESNKGPCDMSRPAVPGRLVFLTSPFLTPRFFDRASATDSHIIEILKAGATAAI